MIQLPIFKDFDGYSPKYHFFKNSLLGQVHDSIPWDELVSCLPDQRLGRGAPSWFGAKGMFSMMFLKSYLNISDRQLLERFNTDWSLQYFCGKVLAENQQIKDMTIMTRIRAYIETHCEWEKLQEILIDHWKYETADFKMEFEPNLPKVNVVPQDIGRVFLNIINNAFQACTMGREPSGLGPLVTVSTKNLGDAIQVSISDNGPGIPEAIKDKIFQPFFTTKAAGQGTGLGLSLSYDIIKAHGGELNVESIEGEGTVFKIQIPIV